MFHCFKYILAIFCLLFLSACSDNTSKNQNSVAVTSKWIVKEMKDPMTDQLSVLVTLNSNSQNSMLAFYCEKEARFNWKVMDPPSDSSAGGVMDDMRVDVVIRFDDGQVVTEKWLLDIKHGMIIPPNNFFDNVLSHNKAALKASFIFTDDVLSVFDIAGLNQIYSKYQDNCKVNNVSFYN